jgi:CBS domain-containing protein
MNISRIYTRDVIRVPQATTLRAAAEAMRASHVGCLVVTENEPCTNRAIGIVTDRDMVVQAMASGADPRETTVAEVMTPKLARIAENADAYHALDKMATLGVRRLAVTDDRGAVVGLLSLDDVIDGFAIELRGAARVLRKERSREIEAIDAPDEVVHAAQFTL